MQVDWLTVAAQIVNFLVLVWLLQRFLYRPISEAMRRREERIAARLNEARETRASAEREARRLEERQADLDARCAAILDAARARAEDLRTRLEADIRDEMEAKRATWRDHLAAERAALVASLRRQAGHHVLRVTERILADYADTELVERVVSSFTRKLETLDQETREKLAAAARDEPALVQTGAAIESGAKARITRAIHAALATDIRVDYREDSDLVLGVRLTIGDHTVEWSAARYLERLESEFAEIIDSDLRGLGRDTAGERASA